jgi:colicin import membrane protein
MIPKGYRAREAAAEARRKRKLVSDEVRAERAAILFAKEAGADEVEVATVDDGADAAADKAVADVAAADKEAADKAAAEKEAADKAAADKAAAEKKAADKAAKKTADKAK